MDDEGAPAEGRRERKKRETQRRIAETAIRLFLERGFDETTLDVIAEASDIARRTFFHYFDSKEAILATIEAGAETRLWAALDAQPPDRPPLDAVLAAMRAMVESYGTREARELDRLLRSTEALRARKQANYEHQERALFAAMLRRWPDETERPRLRVTAMVAIGALRLAADAWHLDGGARTLHDHLGDVCNALRGAGI